MNTNHTDGEWYYEMTETEDRADGYVGAAIFAKVPHLNFNPQIGLISCAVHPNACAEETATHRQMVEANARLIAAAPELLAFARRYLDSEATTAECDMLARAAIAKATSARTST
jgi:hypothetical protein